MDHTNEIFTDSYSRCETQSHFLPNPLFVPKSIFEENRIETPTSTTASFISEAHAHPIQISTTDQQYIQSDNSGVVFKDIAQLINLASICQTEDGMTGKAKFKDGFIFLENLKTHFENTQTDIIERDVRIAALLKENEKLKQDKKHLQQKNQTIFLQFGVLRKKYAKLESEIKMRENKTEKQLTNSSFLTKPQINLQIPKQVSIRTSADLQNLNSIPREHQHRNRCNEQIESRISNSTLVNSAQPKSNQTDVRKVIQIPRPDEVAMSPSYRHCMEWIANGISEDPIVPKRKSWPTTDPYQQHMSTEYSPSSQKGSAPSTSNTTNVSNDDYAACNTGYNYFPILDLF